jgi:uncharacterized protein (TIGR00369 family)
MAMDDPLQHGWKQRELPGFVGLVGPLWTRKEDNAWAYAVWAEGRHGNPAGLVHGGLLVTLLDHALSAIAWEANGRKPCVTVALDTQFLAAARPGDFLEARGRIAQQTSSLVFMQGSIMVATREIVTATAILKVLSSSP